MIKKLLVYGIEYLAYCYKRAQRDVKLLNYTRKAIIGTNFCETAYNPLSGSGLLIFNRGPRENLKIGDNVVLECKINCNTGASLRIGDYTSIREHSVLNCDNSITIGSHCFIGDQVIIQDNDSHPESPEMRLQQSLAVLKRMTDTQAAPSAPIIIGDKVWIGTRATILKGVTIGVGSIIGTGAVVTRSIPPMCLAAGNPARVIRPLKNSQP